jgi:hypothetical protein
VKIFPRRRGRYFTNAKVERVAPPITDSCIHSGKSQKVMVLSAPVFITISFSPILPLSVIGVTVYLPLSLEKA